MRALTTVAFILLHSGLRALAAEPWTLDRSLDYALTHNPDARIFAVAEQRARLHLVKTGKRLGDDFEILSGLDDVKAVVVTGANSLTDGQSVEAN